ncbi:uncharacterized protein LOC135087433 isoform X1 [Ostrinia nubilalis]|uniref:uncharacterized protein LOC135087433 isoform X1 n=2 Tax=Ostrinia nubilalis TaxID=29057 RepID=UPI0030822800
MMVRVFLVVLLVGWCHGQDGSPVILYPCGVSNIDMDCVRAFMYQNIDCTPSCHSDGQPVSMPTQYAYLPSLNVTAISSGVEVTYGGSQVVAFYLNTATNILVFALDFSSLEFYSSSTLFQLAQRKAEPKTVSDYVRVTYAPELTANIKYRPLMGLTFDDVTVTAYHKEPFPHFEVGPNVTQSPDAEVRRKLQLLLNDETTAVQEIFLTTAYYDFFGFVKAYLCDFGSEYNGAVNRS